MPGFITNIWARYWDRPYQMIKDSVLTRLGVKVPEITDHTDNDPYVAEIDIFAGVHEMLGYYIDNAGRESFLDSCRLYKSGISASRRMDYKVIGNLAYRVNVQFILNIAATGGTGAITIPAGTIVSKGSIQYVTQTNAVVAIGDTVSTQVGALQYTQTTGVSLGVSTAMTNMLVVFADKVLHDSIVFYVNGVAWTSVESMSYSLPTDEVFVQTVGDDGKVNIYTGNGTMYGAIPGIGLPMTADYKVTLGLDGFVNVGEITTIVTPLILPVGYTATVSNPERASGASDVESLASLKEHIPISVRTLIRAVTFDDYSRVAELCPGVLMAGTYFNCGKKVEIFIVPDGGGIADLSLIATCQTWMNKRKMITTNVVVKAAGEVHFLLAVDVTAYPNYTNASVKTNVENALLDWMGVLHQRISGTVFLSDLYEHIENATGVKNSVITIMNAVPYARPSSTTVHILNWTRSVLSGSSATVTWQMVFTDSTHFQLIRAGILVGTYPISTLVSLADIAFTVLAGSYTSGDIFTFVTYPYTPRDEITLDEPSLPVSVLGDLTVNVTGGL